MDCNIRQKQGTGIASTFKKYLSPVFLTKLQFENFVLVLFVFFCCFGCSKRYWAAKVYLVQAENAYTKAYALRVKKDSHEEQARYYRRACDLYILAYDNDEHVFTLGRIETAIGACHWVNDVENKDRLIEFEKKYVREHPKEVEYGDVGPFINME